MTDQVGRQPKCDVFADEFAEVAEDGFFNAHYDRPACLSLLGDVAGRRVPDAACGPGLYAEELIRRGAPITQWWRYWRPVRARTPVGRVQARHHTPQ